MTPAPDTIVMIHGLWMNSRSWEHWSDRYRAAGFVVIDDGWPGMDVEVEALRRNPAPIADLTIQRIVDHYQRIISRLEHPPIIIGHSFGGAFTQVLLDRGLGAAGVAIGAAAVRGVKKLPLSTLRTGWPILRNPLNRRRAVPISLEQFHYRFSNHLSIEKSAPLYERYCVPGAGHVLFEGAAANLNPKSALKVDFRNDRRAPLLFIAGGIDHVSPPSVNKSNVKHYRKSPAITDYKEFAERSHFTIGQHGWEAIADYALNWATNAATNNAPRHSNNDNANTSLQSPLDQPAAAKN